MTEIVDFHEEPSGGIMGKLIRHPYLTALAFLAVGGIISYALFSTVNRLENNRLRDNFRLVALKHHNLLEQTIHNSISPLETLHAFYRSSDSVYRGEFKSFVEPLLAQHREIQSLQWIPKVTLAQKSAYERTARREGVSGFQVRSWPGLKAEAVPSDDSSKYPIYVVEPIRENEDLYGVDLASHPGLQEALVWSRDQDVVAATQMITLAQRPDPGPVMFVLRSVYQSDGSPGTVRERRDQLQGYVAATYRVEDIVSQTLSSRDREQFDIFVYDMMAPAEKQLFFRTGTPDAVGAPKFESDEEISDGDLIVHSAVLNLADRLWSVRYLPSELFLRSQATDMAVTVFVAGALMSLLLALGAIISLRHSGRIRKVTVQLQTAMDKLEQDMFERKKTEHDLRLTQFAVDKAADAAYWMGPDARFIYVNDAACRSLGYTKEELLRMAVHDIDPNFPNEVWSKHWKDLEQFRSFTIKSTHRAKEGRTFPVEISVNLVEFEGRKYNCAYARDMSEDTQVYREPETSLCSFPNFADNTSYGIAVISPRLKLLYINRQLKKWYPGVDPASGRACFEVFNSSAPGEECAHCPARQTLEDGGTHSLLVRREIEGCLHAFKVVSSPIRDKSDNIIAIVEMTEDCTVGAPQLRDDCTSNDHHPAGSRSTAG